MNMLNTMDYDLSTVITGGLFNPFSTVLEDTFNLMDLVSIERIETHRLEVTFLLANDEYSFQFHTLFTDINELTLEEAIERLFEFVSYDVDRLEQLADLGLLGELLSRLQLQVIRSR